jgi:hypothetical protein
MIPGPVPLSCLSVGFSGGANWMSVGAISVAGCDFNVLEIAGFRMFAGSGIEVSKGAEPRFK